MRPPRRPTFASARPGGAGCVTSGWAVPTDRCRSGALRDHRPSAKHRAGIPFVLIRTAYPPTCSILMTARSDAGWGWVMGGARARSARSRREHGCHAASSMRCAGRMTTPRNVGSRDGGYPGGHRPDSALCSPGAKQRRSSRRAWTLLGGSAAIGSPARKNALGRSLRRALERYFVVTSRARKCAVERASAGRAYLIHMRA